MSSSLQSVEFQVVIPNKMLAKEGNMNQVWEEGKHLLPLVHPHPFPSSFSGHLFPTPHFQGAHPLLTFVGWTSTLCSWEARLDQTLYSTHCPGCPHLLAKSLLKLFLILKLFVTLQKQYIHQHITVHLMQGATGNSGSCSMDPWAVPGIKGKTLGIVCTFFFSVSLSCTLQTRQGEHTPCDSGSLY